MGILRKVIAGLFTTDDSILNSIAALLPITLAFSFIDSHQAALTGVIQGVGRQHVAAPVVFVCYWILGVPLGVCLALGAFGTRWGLEGLWTGMLVAVTGHFLSFAVGVHLLDWRKIT